MSLRLVVLCTKQCTSKLTKLISMSKRFIVRAYCTECGRLLSSSKDFYKKELPKYWDTIVLGAPNIVCSSCNFKFPNFHIDLRIYDSLKDVELKPKSVLPKPKTAEALRDFQATYVMQSTTQQATANSSLSSIISRSCDLRKTLKPYGKKQAN
jgi:hypothetical protein